MKALIRSRMPILKSAALATALAAGVLLLAQPVHAGTNAAAVEATRAKDQQERQDRQQRQEQREQRPQPQQQQQRAAPPPPVSRAPQSQGPQNAGAPPAYRAPAQVNRLPQNYGGNNGRSDGRRDDGRRDGSNWRDDRRPGNGNVAVRPNPRTDGYRQPPPRQVVPRLPPGYRQYAWRGSHYYNYGGRWYRPYGGSYVVIGAPYGLFVNYLPSYYSTTWVGGSRYYYADDTYYLYEPQRRGYIVTRSPYDDSSDVEDSDESQDEDLFIYPMRGQSEKQQADDRYECHRWAVDETKYDPTDADYDREDREQYDRALTACLTGRGYSVK